MDSTNLSANQASYNCIKAPKKENLTSIRETIFLVLLIDQAVDPEFQYIKSHVLQLIYLKYKWNAFPVFSFYTQYSSFNNHKNKVINKNC